MVRVLAGEVAHGARRRGPCRPAFERTGGSAPAPSEIGWHRCRAAPAHFACLAPRRALAEWIKLSGLASDGFLFPSRVHASPHLSTRQYARIVDSWVKEIGLDPAAYGTHSIRRTKPSLIYRRTKNLRAVQLLLGHTKLESTVRYLGIEVEDALELAEQTEV